MFAKHHVGDEYDLHGKVYKFKIPNDIAAFREWLQNTIMYNYEYCNMNTVIIWNIWLYVKYVKLIICNYM